MKQNLKNAIPGISSFLLLITFCSMNMFAQSENDRTLVLQECLNMYELQEPIVGSDPQSTVPVYLVLSPEVLLPEGAVLISFGKRVELVTEAVFHEREIAAFFRVSVLEIADRSGKAVFSYTFPSDASTGSYSTIEVTAELGKTPNGWSVTKKTLK